MKLKRYPIWCCHECGVTAMTKPLPEWSVSTYHVGICGMCNKEKAVTEPRDFGYPRFYGHDSPWKARDET